MSTNEHAECRIVETVCCESKVDLDCDMTVSQNDGDPVHYATWGDDDKNCREAYERDRRCFHNARGRLHCGQPVWGDTDMCEDCHEERVEDSREQAQIARAEARAGR